MHGSSWNVTVRMQLWIDCGCTVHVMALKTANGLEENPWYYQQQCEVSVKLGCSEHPENSQIVPVCFVIICLLTLFHLCILAEVLFLKRASLSVLLVYHCVDFFFLVMLNPRQNHHLSQASKKLPSLMNVTILFKIFLLSSMYLALIWEVELW